jgi:hypothetical protein
MKIAMTGKMGVGKDICIKYLINKYGGTKIAFSDYLYDILHYAQKVCGFKLQKDRKFLQFIGTDWGREKDDNVWINLTLKKIKKTQGYIYISDCRFVNEFNALKNDDFIIIKIVRNKIDYNREGTGTRNHISETELDSIPNENFNYILENNSSLKILYHYLDIIIDDIINKQQEDRILYDVNKLLEDE